MPNPLAHSPVQKKRAAPKDRPITYPLRDKSDQKDIDTPRSYASALSVSLCE